MKSSARRDGLGYNFPLTTESLPNSSVSPDDVSDGMDSKGSSLPSMPEPAKPVSMKQLAESLSVRSGGGSGGDLSGDPSLLLDKAAATLQDSVLQKMVNHSHNGLREITSRMLNGDQDALPKRCDPMQPTPESAEVPATNGNHQCSSNSSSPPQAEPPELKATVPQVVQQPCCTDETSLINAMEESVSGGPEKRQDTKTKRGSVHKAKSEAEFSPDAVPMETLVRTDAEDGGTAQLEIILETPSLPLAHSVGDLVWAKVSGYPWWPCMVTSDPEFNSHFKPKQKIGSKSGILYHVQYFGDAPERGYIFEKNMVSFRGEHQYQNLSQRNKQQQQQQQPSRALHKNGVPLIPRKHRAQWNMGIIQAKEALNMSLEERMATFQFVYDDEGPHLNPSIMEMLKPEVGFSPELLSSVTLLSVGAGERLNGLQASTSLDPKLQVEERCTYSQDPLAPVFTLCLHRVQISEAPGEPVVAALPKKKRRNAQQPQSTPTKTVRRRKRENDDNTSDPMKKRKPRQVPPIASDPSLAASTTAGEKVKKGRKKKSPDDDDDDEVVKKTYSSVTTDSKKTAEKPQSDSAAEKSQLSKRRRRTKKDAEKEASSTLEETGKKQRRRRRRKSEEDATETKRLPVLLPGEPDAEKPKRRRKRKQEGESQETASKVKKRRLSPSPDSEVSGSEGRPDSPSDSLDGTKKGERKKEFVCQVCEQAGEELVPCEGQCCGMFHLQCLGESFKPEEKLQCQECSSGLHSCFQCKRADGTVRRCHVPHCGKFYHEACIRLNPLTVLDNKGFRCPLHTCLGCYYGNRTKNKSTKGRLMRCLRCPVAYHMGEQCVAAGSEMVTSTTIVCTNHFNGKKAYSHHSHVNVSWCFVCSKGGRLLCCESCPAAFHPDCLNIAMPDGSWFCNDCRAGKKPKYSDIIWVKLGTYRWWPAEIHHPRNVPTNIQHLRHQIGEFPVFFFGSRDYFWTHQGRVFPYMEGDRGSKYQRNGIGKVFKNALLEAEARFKEIKLKREAREAQQNSRKPPPYKSIKVNKPVGKVQVFSADVSEIPKCNCKPSDERPCGFESECLNRMLQYECHPEVCPSGDRCCNQDFTQRRYPDTKIIKTPGKGWGLITLRDIKKGEFVNEYIGELIDEEECRARIKLAQENNVTNFYMLTIDKDRIIDAGPKGNYSRFMNHSCQPNCETQKWTVNGDTRVGLFAVCDVPVGTELTFNYNLDCLGNEKTVCRCGAPNCSGFLGDRPKNSNGAAAEPKGKRTKRKYRKRKTEGKKKSEDECFRCGDGGQLVLCNKKGCTKAYHLSCLNLSKRPFGRWDCPWHHCDVCGKNSEAFCQLCPNSFCKAHQEGALRPRPLAGGPLCCQEHDELLDSTVSSSPTTTSCQEQEVASEAAAVATSTSRPTKGCRAKGSKRKAAEA